MRWLRALELLREGREPGVLVTITAVRGHAPREAGAKMVVGKDSTWDTIGGGNLEAGAIQRARRLLAARPLVAPLADAPPGAALCPGVSP